MNKKVSKKFHSKKIHHKMRNDIDFFIDFYD